MIKCPHCGSTAQPKMVGNVMISENGKYFSEVYKCGCGCKFEALFPRVEVEEYVVWHLEDLSDKQVAQKKIKKILKKVLTNY